MNDKIYQKPDFLCVSLKIKDVLAAYGCKSYQMIVQTHVDADGSPISVCNTMDETVTQWHGEIS